MSIARVNVDTLRRTPALLRRGMQTLAAPRDCTIDPHIGPRTGDSAVHATESPADTLGRASRDLSRDRKLNHALAFGLEGGMRRVAAIPGHPMVRRQIQESAESFKAKHSVEPGDPQELHPARVASFLANHDLQLTALRKHVTILAHGVSRCDLVTLQAFRENPAQSFVDDHASAAEASALLAERHRAGAEHSLRQGFLDDGHMLRSLHDVHADVTRVEAAALGRDLEIKKLTRALSEEIADLKSTIRVQAARIELLETSAAETKRSS